MKNFRLNRRSVLRGAGTAISLPLLEAMLPNGKSAFAQSARPARMLCYYVPSGIHMQAWTPSSTGRDYQLSPTLAPLAQVIDDVLVLSNIDNLPGDSDGTGDHAAGTGAFLTATHVKKTEGSDILNGISVDQVAANKFGTATRFPSLQLGMDGGGSSGGCDSGYSCAYARNISWAGPRTPLPKMTDPQKIFDRLFAGQNTDAATREQELRNALKKSILDSVIDDAKKMESKLGMRDREKLQEYLTSIEQVERSLANQPNANACVPPARPGSGLSYTQKMSVMTQLMRLAFECDATRFITFMLGNAVSGRAHTHLGISEGHHTISHHGRSQSNYDKLKLIDKWEVGQFAELLISLKNTNDIEGVPLLDSCVLYFSSDIEDGDAHRHTNLPVLLAGKCNGYFDTGRHVRYNRLPMANLFMSMLDAVGAPVTSFGDDSTGLLPNLKS